MDVKVEHITKLLSVLSWQKIIQATVALFILGTAYGFYENRTIIYNTLRVGAKVETDDPMILVLSPATTTLLDETVSRMRSTVAGIAVTNVNFKKNNRSIAYFAINDETLRRAYDDFQITKVADTVLFNDDEFNNQRIINLINGEFICNEYKKTISAKSMPTTVGTISTICSISIPPYYGRFSGYMTIFLIKTPTTDEVAIIRQVARDISLRIYETDVDKSSKYIYDKK